MDHGEDISEWLVQKHKKITEEKHVNVFHSLGLSSCLEDWLVKSEEMNVDNFVGQAFVDSSISMEDTELQPGTSEHCGSRTPASSPSFAVQPVEEILKRGLDSWLCEPEINTKLQSVLRLEQERPKRKRELAGNDDDNQVAKVSRT